MFKSSPRFHLLQHLFAALLLCLSAGCSFADPAPAVLESDFGADGVASLKWGETSLLKDGKPITYWTSLQRADKTAYEPTGAFQGSTMDKDGRTVTLQHTWGTVKCSYIVKGDRLEMPVEIENTGKEILNSTTVQLLLVNFPKVPANGPDDVTWADGWSKQKRSVNEPLVVAADYGSGTMAFAQDEPSTPIEAGFRSSGSKTDYVVGFTLQSPLPPGETAKFNFSLRFGPTGSATQLATSEDLRTAFAKAYPFSLKWADRRPIGVIFHANPPQGADHPKENARGWIFFDPARDGDINTEEGKANFRTRLLAFADNSIRILKQMNAQGVMLWDIEGQQFPHVLSYIGDPRLVELLAPEMAWRPDADLPKPTALKTVDAYIKKYHDAGLKVGFCLRPQKLREEWLEIARTKGATETPGHYQNTNPQLDTSGAEFSELLKAKAQYARDRFGARMFYVDSNIVNANIWNPEQVFDELYQQYPDTLFVPEWATTRTYASSASYGAFNHATGAVTSEDVRKVYPKAFRLTMVGDIKPEQVPVLEEAVRSGDILMFRAWFDDGANAIVKGIYDKKPQ